MTTRIASHFLMAFVLLFAAGCDRINTQVEKARYAGMSDLQVVEKRIQERWDAALAGRFDQVYLFATPQYRATYDMNHFRNQYALQVDRTHIKVHEIKIDPADPATAQAVVLIYFVIAGWGDQTHESYTRVVETWVKRDGMWWFVEKK